MNSSKPKEKDMTNQTNQPAEDAIIVTVVHTAFEDRPAIVARVTCEGMDITEALEYAYRSTQNIDGSWSRAETMWVRKVRNGFDQSRREYNADFNADVEAIWDHGALDDLVLSRGGQIGYRSTSMHDLMVVGSRIYEVISVGYEEVDYDLGNDDALWMMPTGRKIPVRNIIVDVATQRAEVA